MAEAEGGAPPGGDAPQKQNGTAAAAMETPSFGHLKRLEIRDREAWCYLPEVTHECRVKGRPATLANEPLANHVLRRSGKRERALARDRALQAADRLAAARAEDLETFARFVITGWEGVLDDKNQPVAFSVGACRAFLKQLPDWLFTRIRLFFKDEAAFLDEEEEAPDPEELAGNS